MFPGEMKPQGGGGYKEALIAGACFALAALLSSFLILSFMRANNAWQGLIVAAPAAALITGALLWKIFFSRGRRPSLWRGAGVGALVGIASHPFAWYFLLVWMYAAGVRSSTAERTLDPLAAVPGSFLYSAMSIIIVGWVTAPVGALVGGALGFAANINVADPAAPRGAGQTADYSGIDHALYAWAQRRGLPISANHQGRGGRSIFFAGSSGRQYHIWVEAPDQKNEVHIRAWDHERMLADAVSSMYDLGVKLEEVYATVMSWDASQHQ